MNISIKILAGIAIAGAILAVTRASDEAATEPTELRYLLGDTLINAEGEPVSVSQVAAGKIGILFATEACPTYRGFIPYLIDMYREIRAADKSFEVVLVSMDRDEERMFAHMRNLDMPWPAVPHRSERARLLQEHFNVRSLPALVVIDSAGKTLHKNARHAVVSGGAQAYDKW